MDLDRLGPGQIQNTMASIPIDTHMEELELLAMAGGGHEPSTTKQRRTSQRTSLCSHTLSTLDDAEEGEKSKKLYI